MKSRKLSAIKYIILSLGFLTLLWFVKENVATKTETHIEHKGTLACFSENEKSGNKKTCELSSAARFGEYIVTANDKVDDEILLYKIDSLTQQTYQRKILPALKIKLEPDYKVKKIESTSVFKDWIIMFGSYDRNVDPLFTKIIALKFNQQTKKATDFHVVAGPELYDVFKKLISTTTPNGVDYFKIEASAIVPKPGDETQSMLLLGVREDGKSYKDDEKQATTKIIGVSITEKDGKVTLGSDWKIIYNREHTKDFGISSLEYNPEDKFLYVLLALEKNQALSGKILRIGLPDLFNNKALESVDEVSFKNHKPEGLSYLGRNKFFVIADDDRKETPLPDAKRDMNEAVYWIISQRTK